MTDAIRKCIEGTLCGTLSTKTQITFSALPDGEQRVGSIEALPPFRDELGSGGIPAQPGIQREGRPADDFSGCPIRAGEKAQSATGALLVRKIEHPGLRLPAEGPAQERGIVLHHPRARIDIGLDIERITKTVGIGRGGNELHDARSRRPGVLGVPEPRFDPADGRKRPRIEPVGLRRLVNDHENPGLFLREREGLLEGAGCAWRAL